MMGARAATWLACAALALAPGCALFRKPAWEQPPPPARDAPVVQPGSLHRAELDNGVEVLVLEDHRLPRAVLGVAVRRGAGIEALEVAGIAAFTAELMRRGAGSRDALALAEATDALGAHLSVSSDWDQMEVRVGGLSRDLDRLIEILADVTLRPRFEAAEAKRARGEILASLEQAKDDPTTLAGWALVKALYPGHRYGIPEDGTPESVARLDAGMARAFHRSIFLPNDAILFAAGDVDMDGLLPRLGVAFGAWERGEVVPPGAAPPALAPPERRIVVVDRPDLGQVQIALAHEGIRRTDPERIAAALVNTVLGGGGFASRLMHRLRSQGGLTYSVSSGFDLRRHPGPFSVGTFTRVEEVRRILDLTLEEMARIRSEPPSEEELRDARALLVGSFSLGLETSAAVVGALVDLDVYGLPQDSLDRYRRKVRRTGADETTRIAKSHFHPERMAIALVGPAAAIVPQVEDLGPVEVQRP